MFTSLVAVGAAGCPSLAPFGCLDDGDCDRSEDGMCLGDGACAYADDTCESGLRRSPNASDDPGLCVPVGSSTSTTSDTTDSTTSGTTATTATTAPLDTTADTSTTEATADADSTGVPTCGLRRALAIDTSAMGPEAIENLAIPIQLLSTPIDEATNDGTDVFFTDDSGSRLPHEVETIDPAAGELLAWVRLGAWTVGQALTIFVHYGDVEAAGVPDPTGVWPEYIGVWHLTGGVDGFALDSSASGAHGTVMEGDQRFAPGPVGNALEFRGDDDDTVVMTESFGGELDSFTISMWATTSNAANEDGPFFDRAGGHNLYPRCRRRPEDSGGIILCQYEVDGGVRPISTNGNAVAGDELGHFALTWDADAGFLRVYVNGMMRTEQMLATGMLATGDNGMRLGKVETLPPLVGRIDEVRVAPSDLGAARILADYVSQSNLANLIESVGDAEPAPCP